MCSTSCACTRRGRRRARRRLGGNGRREAGRRERGWPDDSEHGGRDDVAFRSCVARRSSVISGVGSVSGGSVSAERPINPLSAECPVCPPSVQRPVGSFNAECPVAPFSAQRTLAPAPNPTATLAVALLGFGGRLILRAFNFRQHRVGGDSVLHNVSHVPAHGGQRRARSLPKGPDPRRSHGCVSVFSCMSCCSTCASFGSSSARRFA
jgi:hypothetical protein